MMTGMGRWVVLTLAVSLSACNKPKQPEERTAQESTAPPAAKVSSDIDSASTDNSPLKLTPRSIGLSNGKSFKLNVPEEFDIQVAAEGLKRVRFMAESPDHRIFVTDMFNLSDNNKGTLY